jgi:hypothetical protein
MGECEVGRSSWGGGATGVCVRACVRGCRCVVRVLVVACSVSFHRG